ncbi:hypothetical protein VNO77_29360 [Canavalia gladiata]|uniref:Uncharacterized protein n=1 Tax=Canavalia gladiata TaxID=3824 RepID=A0AAN9Q7S9_CANGL
MMLMVICLRKKVTGGVGPETCGVEDDEHTTRLRTKSQDFKSVYQTFVQRNGRLLDVFPKPGSLRFGEPERRVEKNLRETERIGEKIPCGRSVFLLLPFSPKSCEQR